MQALVTRPIEDAEPLVAALAARGIAALVEPMLRIRRLGGPPPDLAGVQAVLLTSANGARALAAASAHRDLPVFAVGDATAAAARAAGFVTVASADGDVEDLAALVAARLSPADGTLLHAAGSAVAGDLAGRLGEAGFTLRRAVLYAADPATALSGEAAEALRQGRLDLAFFFSPRTASAFVRLVAAAGTGAACGGVSAFCLSPAVAAALGALAWRRTLVAAAPTQAALLAALDDFLAGLPAIGATRR